MTTLPLVLSLVRLALAFPLALAILRFHLTAALAMVVLACLTDVLDGWLARRLRTASPVGAVVDVVADIAVVIAATGAFVAQGVYPTWLLWLIGIMAGQFLATSMLGRVVYDPVGKYFGAWLFAVILCTIVLPDLAVWNALLEATLLLTAISVTSRVTWFLAADLSGSSSTRAH